MATIKAGILGFGTVGQGIYHILNEKRQELREKLGVELEVAKILVTDASRERVPGTKHLMTESMDEVLAEVLPGFLVPLAVEVGKIKEMAVRTQKTMRLAKKAIERVGDRFWMDADPLPKMV